MSRKKLEEKCKDLAQQYQSMFLDGNAATHANPNNIQLMKYRNLLSLFEKILQKENQLERQKMKSLATIESQKANSSAPQHNDESSGQLEDGQQALLAPLSQHEREELEQRERDIKQIHNSVQLINEIFTDLGIIVMQQQDLVDCVELNMENAAADIHQANREIFITTETTQRNRFRCCGLPIGLLLFLGGMLTLLAWFLMKF